MNYFIYFTSLYKYLRYQWFNLWVLLKATSSTRLTLCMRHLCVCMGSFVLDYHALYWFAALHVHRIEIPYWAFPKRAVHEFYRLKALILWNNWLLQWSKKRTILISRNLRVSGKSEAKIENRESGIEDRLKNLENKRNKKNSGSW